MFPLRKLYFHLFLNYEHFRLKFRIHWTLLLRSSLAVDYKKGKWWWHKNRVEWVHGSILVHLLCGGGMSSIYLWKWYWCSVINSTLPLPRPCIHPCHCWIQKLIVTCHQACVINRQQKNCNVDSDVQYMFWTRLYFS